MLQVKESHLSEYGKEPEIVVSAPGRFHLIGEIHGFSGIKLFLWL